MQLIITRFFTAPAVPAEDPLGIGIDDKAMMIPGVKEHAIGSLRADAIDGQELLTDGGGFALKHPLQACAMFLDEYVDKVAESFGLDIKVAGRADKLGQLLVTEGIYLSC